MNVPMKHTPIVPRVVVQRVTATHVRAVQLTGMRSTARIVRGPTSLVETTFRVDQPVVLDVDVGAAVERVRIDAAHDRGRIARIAGRRGVMHDQLLDDGVVVGCPASQGFVRAPLRTRDHRRRGPVRIRYQHARRARKIDRGAPLPDRRCGATAIAAPAPAARRRARSDGSDGEGVWHEVPGPGTRDNPRDRRNRDRRSRSRPRKHTRRDPANLGHPLATPCDTNARCPRAHTTRWRSTSRRSWACARESALLSRKFWRRCRNSTAAPDLVPYTLSLHAREHRADVPSDTRFVPIPARVLLPAWGRFELPASIGGSARRRCMHATNYLDAAEPAADDRQRLRLLLRPVPRALHARRYARSSRSFGARDRDGARRFTPLQSSSRDEIEEIFGPGLRHRGRLVVIPLGVPRSVPRRRCRAAVRRATRRARRTCSRSERSNRGRTSPHLVAAFGTIAARHPDVRLVIAGHDGPARPDVDAAIGAPRARCRSTRSPCRPGRRRRSPCAARRGRAARVPVDLRRLRFPGARGDVRAACRSLRRVRARSRRSRAMPRCSSKPTDDAELADAIGPSSHRRQRLRRELIAPRARPRPRVLVGGHRPESGACYRR